MRNVRFFSALALLAGVSLYGAAANAEVSQDVRQACTPDAMRLCSEFIPDVAKITACMKAKHAQLSSACLTAMRGSGEHETTRGAKHVAKHERREVRHERHEVRHERHEARHERHEARHEYRHHGAHGHCDPFTHMCN